MTAPREPAAPRPPVQGDMPPPGLVCVRLRKGCVLPLSEGEYMRAVRRGKAWRRRVAMGRREGTQ